MRNPLVQYLIGTCILSVGLVIFLSSAEIAKGLDRFWERWLGKRAGEPSSAHLGSSADFAQPPHYRIRRATWRALGALIAIDGFVWLARATVEVFHALPNAKP